MKIELFQPLYIHEIGTRDNQEDALWPKNPTIDDRLFVLCDGMGGHEHGEVASQTVTQALGKWFAEHVDATSPLSDDQLRDAIEYAYTQLDSYADGSIDKSQYASFGKVNDRAAYDTASFYTDVPDGA
jgi:protein phosphatase